MGGIHRGAGKGKGELGKLWRTSFAAQLWDFLGCGEIVPIFPPPDLAPSRSPYHLLPGECGGSLRSPLFQAPQLLSGLGKNCFPGVEMLLGEAGEAR